MSLREVVEDAVRRKSRLIADTLAETLLAERPWQRTTLAVLGALRHAFFWLLWFVVCFGISLPSILFAMAEARHAGELENHKDNRRIEAETHVERLPAKAHWPGRRCRTTRSTRSSWSVVMTWPHCSA